MARLGQFVRTCTTYTQLRLFEFNCSYLTVFIREYSDIKNCYNIDP